MDKFLIRGGKTLSGKVEVSAAKNATLPILAATLLTEEPCVIRNVPMVQDVRTMAKLLGVLGKKVEPQGGDLVLSDGKQLNPEAPYDIVKQMRASYYVLGPLLARERRAKVSLPGGCAIGPRPVDLHIKGMKALGAEVVIEHGYISAQTKHLTGAEMVLEGSHGPSVGATANVMMAATLARGRTVILGAACEPEVIDLANFLNALGAGVSGIGTPRLVIDGVEQLHGAEYQPIPDRIEAGTLALAGAITRGRIELNNCQPEHMTALLEKLNETGCECEVGPRTLRVNGGPDIRPVDINTAPYPGFPTDCQAQFMALLCLASGRSVVTEHIFEGRFLHALELARMGARIDVDGNKAIIDGIPRFSGAPVMASDIRASASLVLAGLAAEGETEISRIYHLDRGYVQLEEKLTKLGADVRRVK
jgi:UDP-N-acetylglucosamine 1-carboxyvinyltransferase